MARRIQDEMYEHGIAEPMLIINSIREARKPASSQKTKGTQGSWRGMLHVVFPKVTLGYGPAEWISD